MTIIIDTCAHNFSTIKFYSDSMHICVWSNFSNVSTILPLYMTDLFWGWGNISYSCYQSNHEWLKTYWKRIIRFSICYVEIQLHRVSKFQVVMYFFYLTFICNLIKPHQSNQTRSTTLRNFIGSEYSSYLLFIFLTYNTCIYIIYVA
jgi:hypothetical protein